MRPEERLLNKCEKALLAALRKKDIATARHMFAVEALTLAHRQLQHAIDERDQARRAEQTNG